MKSAQLRYTSQEPLTITVERASSTQWRVIVFKEVDTQRYVDKILECDDPAYWVERMKLPENTLLHESIAGYKTGRTQKLSSRIARIVQQKQKESN
jgi:hypothetical protein